MVRLQKAEKIELMEIRGINKLKFRERNIFEGHDDHGHKEDDVMIMLKKTVMTITIMTKTNIKKTDMMITVMKVMHMVSLIHTYG